MTPWVLPGSLVRRGETWHVIIHLDHMIMTVSTTLSVQMISEYLFARNTQYLLAA